MKSRKSIKEQSIVRVQDQLKKLVDEMARSADVTVTPRAPLVLVYALPKGSAQGLIILPDQQNKPIHEGIVLKVYKPYYKAIMRAEEIGTPHKADDIQEMIEICPSVEVGDHVLFPHASGVPCWPLNKNEVSGLSTHGDFRFIRDDITEPGGMLYGGIIGVIERSTNDVRKELMRILKRRQDSFLSDQDPKMLVKLVNELQDNFVIIDRTLRPLTTSGK